MNLPSYFNEGETATERYYSVGDRVYGVLVIDKLVVRYNFNDGSKGYQDSKAFKSEAAAQHFASRFAAEMRRCDKRQTVPTLQVFREFE